MIDSNDVLALLHSRRAGHTLPQPFYRDPALFDFDVKAIFHREWLMVGFEVELSETGSYLAETIAGSPILLVRQKDGSVRGFHNSCRHRGAQICADGAGRSTRLICPYHQWTYALDGTLLGAGRMGRDFSRSDHALGEIRVELVEGCIYVCLAKEAPDFTPFRRALEPMLAPHRLREGKLATTVTLTEYANWKLVMENGRECHHCATSHPELKIPFPVSNADRGKEADALSAAFSTRMANAGLDVGPHDGPWWQIGRFPFNDGAVSFSMDGAPLVSKRLLEAPGGEVGTLRWAIEPHNFCHAAADNALMFSAFPVSPLETRVVAKWIVHKDAVEGIDYDLDRLTHIWNQTNMQDRDLAENNQRGVNGVGYVPGPYSPDAESYVSGFTDWYCDRAFEYASSSGRQPE